jgi:hypothetical protein
VRQTESYRCFSLFIPFGDSLSGKAHTKAGNIHPMRRRRATANRGAYFHVRSIDDSPGVGRDNIRTGGNIIFMHLQYIIRRVIQAPGSPQGGIAYLKISASHPFEFCRSTTVQNDALVTCDEFLNTLISCGKGCHHNKGFR